MESIKRYYNCLFVLSLLFLISACATVLSGTTQKIRIKVVESTKYDELQGVSCKVFDGSGTEYVFRDNPGTVTVLRGSGSISIICNKSGYKQLNLYVGDSFNETSLVNILFWPGFIVDGLTGAYKKYPSHYLVVMEKS